MPVEAREGGGEARRKRKLSADLVRIILAGGTTAGGVRATPASAASDGMAGGTIEGIRIPCQGMDGPRRGDAAEPCQPLPTAGEVIAPAPAIKPDAGSEARGETGAGSTARGEIGAGSEARDENGEAEGEKPEGLPGIADAELLGTTGGTNELAGARLRALNTSGSARERPVLGQRFAGLALVHDPPERPL